MRRFVPPPEKKNGNARDRLGSRRIVNAYDQWNRRWAAAGK
jgi:hypothetical protein